MGSGKKDKNLKITVDHNLEERVKKKISVDAEIQGKNDKGRIDFNELKAGGFIKQRQRGKFTVRLKCPGGRLPIKKLKIAVEAAEKFGKDYVHLSVRQSFEIPYVDFRDFKPLIEMLKTVDQEVASCGPRVRVPTACSGCEYNPNGLTEAQEMAETASKQFFGTRTNHKFKMAFSGCPIDCIRTNESDLGFQGAVYPKWDEPTCIGCTICESACLEGAIESHPETGKPIFDPKQCLYCADCIRACPTSSWKAEKTGWVVRVGGKHGRHPLNAPTVAKFLTDEEVPKSIDATVKWYQKKGEGRNRIRIGDFLKEEGAMESYMKALEEALGADKLVENPSVPEDIVIHR